MTLQCEVLAKWDLKSCPVFLFSPLQVTVTLLIPSLSHDQTFATLCPIPTEPESGLAWLVGSLGLRGGGGHPAPHKEKAFREPRAEAGVDTQHVIRRRHLGSLGLSREGCPAPHEKDLGSLGLRGGAPSTS